MAKREISSEANSLYYIVYFVLCPELNRVKIGFSRDNPNLRLETLRNSSPAELVPLGAISDQRGLERRLHERFAPYRRHGEWFEYVPEIATYIKENAKPWPNHRLRYRWCDPANPHANPDDQVPIIAKTTSQPH